MSARALLAAARRVYAADHEALHALDEIEHRIGQPLRVALVGSVKAGKSTLLNGLLGERIAPTDSRECTRIVTWYRHGRTPSVRGRLVAGGDVTIPTKRQQDRLELDLQSFTAESIERIDVVWPAPGVREITLIDTPGIVSVTHDVSRQTDRFLLPEQGAAGADAVIYLLRSLHESDVRFLQALHAHSRHGQAAAGSIAVLSRADELGGGRLTAMMSINEAVDQLRHHPDLPDVCETIVPVAGLMGLGGMTLRQADFIALRDLSARDPELTRQAMLTAERFITSKADWLPAERTRLDLVDRFGMYGIRIALASLRGGIEDAGELSAELVRRSGLEELRRIIDVHFTQRQDELKAHSAVSAIHRLLRRRPASGSDDLLADADDHMARAHTFTEMNLVGRIPARELDLSPDQLDELERLIGGRGADVHVRLGLSPIPDSDRMLRAAEEHLARWRELVTNPLLDRRTLHACRTAARTCEGIIIALMEDAALMDDAAPIDDSHRAPLAIAQRSRRSAG